MSIEEIVDTQHNCDQATNDMSSQDEISQPAESQELPQQQHQQHAPNTNSTTPKATDDDEDEDRQTNHLYSSYSSFNSTHNHHGNDDDDDCNSSEDTKTNCRSKCDSIKSEQHNGQQEQVRYWYHISFIGIKLILALNLFIAAKPAATTRSTAKAM